MNRIYVACLASYNNGVLHGKWIDATNDADEMQNEVNEVLRTSKFPNVTVKIACPDCMGTGEAPCTASICDKCKGTGTTEVPSAEEFAIHDHEGEALEGIGEYTPLSEIATRVEAAELAETTELGDEGPAIVNAYWDNVGGRPNDAREAVYEARDHYQGQFDSWEKFADNWLEEMGMLRDIPEWAQPYFDSEAYARDMQIGGDYFENNGFFFSAY